MASIRVSGLRSVRDLLCESPVRSLWLVSLLRAALLASLFLPPSLNSLLSCAAPARCLRGRGVFLRSCRALRALVSSLSSFSVLAVPILLLWLLLTAQSPQSLSDYLIMIFRSIFYSSVFILFSGKCHKNVIQRNLIKTVSLVWSN